MCLPEASGCWVAGRGELCGAWFVASGSTVVAPWPLVVVGLLELDPTHPGAVSGGVVAWAVRWVASGVLFWSVNASLVRRL